MFVVEDVPKSKPDDQPKRLVDYDRNVWFQMITRYGQGRVSIFKLVWNNNVIPFQAVELHPVPAHVPGPRKKHLHWHMCPQKEQPFGHSTVANSEGVSDFDFADQQEKTQAERLAIEALLEFGSAYDGKKWDASRHVSVEYNGKIYTKDDFCP